MSTTITMRIIATERGTYHNERVPPSLEEVLVGPLGHKRRALCRAPVTAPGYPSEPAVNTEVSTPANTSQNHGGPNIQVIFR